MTNPLKGIYLNNQWFNYTSDSFRENVALRNTADETQNSKVFSVQGKSKEVFTITLDLENTYKVRDGDTVIGTTTWLGVSRLANFKTWIGGQGADMPITFVTPYGVTYSVVPTGSVDINTFNASNPSSASMEFRVSLTLESV